MTLLYLRQPSVQTTLLYLFRTYNFQDTRLAYSYNCVIAYSAYAYDQYIGDDTYTQASIA